MQEVRWEERRCRAGFGASVTSDFRTSYVIIKISTRSHGSMTVTRDWCCKGDITSQWEKANLPLSPNSHPLTESRQACTHDYVDHICTHAEFGQCHTGGTSPHIAKVITQFLSRVSTLMHCIHIAILSVRPSVRYVPVFYQNGLRYCYIVFTTQ